jgi:hypothetical protein
MSTLRLPLTPRPDPSTALRTSGLGLSSTRAQAEGLSLPAGRQGLTLSGSSFPRLKRAGLGAAEWVNRSSGCWFPPNTPFDRKVPRNPRAVRRVQGHSIK